MEAEILDKRVQEKINKIYNSIFENTKTPFDTLHLFIDKVEYEYRKTNIIIKQNKIVINAKKQEQFIKLSKTINNLFDFIKQNKTDKHINATILITKKILILLYTILDYIQAPPSNKAKFLTKSMGINIIGDILSVIVPKNSKIPIEKNGDYFTAEDDQTEVKSDILIGDNPIASQNIKLGEIRLTGIPKLPAEEAKSTIYFKIDKLGFLMAKQICHETGQIIQKEFDINRYLSD